AQLLVYDLTNLFQFVTVIFSEDGARLPSIVRPFAVQPVAHHRHSVVTDRVFKRCKRVLGDVDLSRIPFARWVDFKCYARLFGVVLDEFLYLKGRFLPTIWDGNSGGTHQLKRSSGKRDVMRAKTLPPSPWAFCLSVARPLLAHQQWMRSRRTGD